MTCRAFFDPQDYELIRLVEAFVQARAAGLPLPRLDSSLHPHGIVEAGISHALRIAYALMTLLDSLRDGDREARLQGLQRLHDEVLHSASSALRYNTGRVLIQLMKELIRARTEDERLPLAHDFHRAAQGAPRVVRGLLARYHLLEMPEAWNQLAFDHHVHDANTCGRKNPTHLVMDAWVKGLRFLTVIYYNRVAPGAVDELLRAARIMDMRVRVGLEFRCAFRGRFVDIVWSPLDGMDAERFPALLRLPAFQQLMRDYRPVLAYMRAHTLALLRAWNSRHAAELGRRLGVELPRLDEVAFLRFVGHRVPMALHLAEYVQQSVLDALEARPAQAGTEGTGAKDGGAEAADAKGGGTALTAAAEVAALTPDAIAEAWFSPARNPEIVFPYAPHPDQPEALRRPPEQLLAQLAALPPAQIILNLASLGAADVLELLWQGQGRITHLELFNLREWVTGRLTQVRDINRLQLAINEGSAPELKHVVQAIVAGDAEAAPERRAVFEAVQRNIPALQQWYRRTPLFSRIGTDSTSRSRLSLGMGLAFMDTLPPRVRRALRARRAEPLFPPVRTDILHVTRLHLPPEEAEGSLRARLRRRFFPMAGARREEGWELEKRTTRVTEKGNLVALGGMHEPEGAGTLPAGLSGLPPRARLNYLNTAQANILKALAGFLPAQWAFWYTDGWWFLVWFGALLWFFITGFRNMAQAVLSGGGVSRTTLLPWKRYISWSRVADSLLYTGLSVLLLEVCVRVWLLQSACGLTVGNNPLAVYSVIALCNGAYIALHNSFRGFPRSAVVGNLFRSVFAIPLSLLLGNALFWLCAAMGVADPLLLVQNCAAITSKCASDMVAAGIEGLADRGRFLGLRRWDYTTKLAQVFANFSRLEMLFVHHNLEDVFERPQELWDMVCAKNPQLAREAVINMLDLMYFWYYLPRARQAFQQRLRTLSPAEKRVLFGMHGLLTLDREISRLLLNGLAGRRFGPALSFYLDQHGAYLRAMRQLAGENM